MSKIDYGECEMMTRRDILYATSWDEFDMGVCKLFVPFFDQYIPFLFFQEHDRKPQITDKMIMALNSIMELEEKEQELYFEEFGESRAIKVNEIHIDQEHDKRDGVYCEIIINMPSKEYMSLIVKDGKIIHLDRDGSYFESL